MKMDRKELESQVIALVATSYGVDASTLTVDKKITEDLGGASIQMVGLVSEIENELDVMVQLQVAAACATIGDLVDKVEEQM
jgi:acyl carrier protein